MGIVRKDYVWKDPDVATNMRVLANVNIAVQTHIVTNFTVALNIPKRTNSKVFFLPSFFRVLSHDALSQDHPENAILDKKRCVSE